MHRVTDTISIDDSELSESFVRSSGPGGQNVNKVSSAVQLRFDVRQSPSLPNDVAVRLMRLAGKRLTKDGGHRHHRAEPPRPGAQPRRRPRAAVRADPGGGGQAGAAPRHQGAQGAEAQAGRGQKTSLRHQKPARRPAEPRLRPEIAGVEPRLCLAGAAPRHYSLAEPRIRPHSMPVRQLSEAIVNRIAAGEVWNGRPAWSRNWSRTRSMPAPGASTC